MIELQPFVFIRHGETDWNRNGLFQGRSDIHLNEAGRHQAREAAREMDKLHTSKVLVSPLMRAVETAKLAFPARLSLIEVENTLIECDFGSLDGKPIKDAMLAHGITRKEQLADILSEDGESWEAVLGRCKSLLEKVAALQKSAPNVVLVGHDAVLQGISEVLTGRWFDSKHCQPHFFQRDAGAWRIVGS